MSANAGLQEGSVRPGQAFVVPGSSIPDYAEPTRLEVALQLAAQGFRIVPSRDKVPVIPEWPDKASSLAATIRAWFSTPAYADCGISVATGRGLVALDIDVKGDGASTLAALERELGPLPPTRRTRTPSGGGHVYLRVPDGVTIGNSVRALGDGLDVRGDGGQVVAVAPGYSWDSEAPIADMPAAWLARLTAKPERSVPVGLEDGELIPEGQRDHTLYRIACSLRAKGLHQAAIRAALTETNSDRCRPPLPQRDVDRIAAQASKHSPGELPAEVRHGGKPEEAGEPLERLLAALVRGNDVNGARLVAPPPLVDGLLFERTIAMIFGQSNAGKSFLAIDWALSHATGRPWCGRNVTPGRSLYIAAEGTAGIGARADAWREHRGCPDTSGFDLLPEPVNLFDQRQVPVVVALAQAVKATLVILDTLSMVSSGADENAARDMNVVMAAAERIKREAGATVLIVHHTGKDGMTYRGSGAIRASCDTMLALSIDDGRIKLETDKQRDAAKEPPVKLTLKPVGQSCVLAEAETQAPGWLPDSQLRVLATLAASDDRALPSNALKEAVGADCTRQYWNHRVRDLADGGYVRIESMGAGRPSYIRLTAAGLLRAPSTVNQASTSDGS